MRDGEKLIAILGTLDPELKQALLLLIEHVNREAEEEPASRSP